MIRDDQDVTEEWILRVDGREYGPANIDTLREWKAEGRVLPANEARRADAELWDFGRRRIPGLFDGEPLATADAEQLTDSISPSQRPPVLPSRGLGHILAETLRIYAEAFFNSFPLRFW